MAENVLKTRIQLKYDTLANWSTSTLVLKRGEIAIAEVPTNASNSGLTPPAIGIKVGDGVSVFSALPWIQATAGDVYSWAKAANKPSYDASEIQNLSSYISGQINDTDTQYQIIAGTGADAGKYFLQSKSLNDASWTTVSTIDISGVNSRLDALEEWASTDYTLGEQITSVANRLIGNLDSPDTAVEHQFVTAVSQTDGSISVSRAALDAGDIATGTLPVARGGTGASSFTSGEVLVGNGTSAIGTLAIDTSVSNNSNNLITSGAVSSYVASQLSGIGNAMHFRGIATQTITDGSTSDPVISGYVFSNAEAGDVIIDSESHKEFVWTGSVWELLGDEGSYVVSGAITDADIASNAAISQSKINGLTAALSGKVDAEEGKGLSTNDYTTADMNKLAGIDAGAEENTIESISLNGTTLTPDANKNVEITIDLSQVGTVQGAQYPSADGQSLQDVTISNKKLQFSRIAATGDVGDLEQGSTILVLDCGNGSDNG